MSYLLPGSSRKVLFPMNNKIYFDNCINFYEDLCNFINNQDKNIKKEDILKKKKYEFCRS